MTDTQTDPADTIRQAAAQKFASIRANQGISNKAALTQLAQAHLAAKGQLDSLRTKAEVSTAGRQSALSAKLLGIGSNDPSAAISHRDAQDRVAAIKPSDSRTPAAMLLNATQSGDTAMSKALLAQAINVGNADLVNQYIDAHPGQQADIEELWDLQHGRKVSGFASALQYTAPPPTELSGLNDYQLQAIADNVA